MGIFDQTETVERQQFFDGQRLLAADLQSLEAFHREMRELHNRSLHQWGIGNGFAVTGERGERQVSIGPGYAIDSDGHEIVLTRPHLEPVPPVAAGDSGEAAFFLLTVSYPTDDDLEEVETRLGLCQTHGAVRLREEPIFCWVRLTRDGAGKLRPVDGRLDRDVREGRKIVLARVEVLECRLENLTIAQRRNARPADQPRIYCGRANPTWTLDLGPFEILSLSAEIDTSEAAFATTPCYSARIDGPRLLQAGGGEFATEFFADGVLSIGVGADGAERPSRPDRFFVVIRLLTGFFDGMTAESFAPWSIEWLGIE